MIPHVSDADVTIVGSTAGTSFAISADDEAHIMGILRDQLYSDKIMAVLREYSSNAWDANRMAGRADVPIEVTLPTTIDPELRIRDHGPGLSLDDVMRVYTRYGRSTKRDSNEAVGMLGIGSKSGFAYSDSFTITSWHGGQKAVYVAVIDPSKRGRIDLMHVEDCGDETGLEIQMSVKLADVPAFQQKARELFQYFKPRPKINCDIPEQKFTALDDDTLIREDSGGGWTAIMGCVGYRIYLSQVSLIGGIYNHVSGVIRFPIGELEVAASREDLKYGEATVAAIRDRISDAITRYVTHLFKDIDKKTGWERRLTVQAISRRYLPIPTGMKHLAAGHVGLKIPTKKFMPPGGTTAVDRPIFEAQCRSYDNKRFHTATSVNVTSGARFVIRDQSKAHAGYTFKHSRDEIIFIDPPSPLTPTSVAKCRKDLEQMIADLDIEGIPVELISSYPWVSPRGPGRARDVVRARARMFVFDPTVQVDDDERAKRWTPIDRIPDPDDVFIVMSSYRDCGGNDFYENYSKDEGLFSKLGLKMPTVYAYKSTAAKPVVDADCKGTSYRCWRSAGRVDLLLSNKSVAKAVQYDYNDTHIGMVAASTVSLYENALGKDHPLVRLYSSAHRDRMTMTEPVHTAVRIVQYERKPKDELEDLRKALLLSYPLLQLIAARVGGQYLEYVKQLDRLRELEDLVKKKEMAA